MTITTRPKQDRAIRTRERLLDVASELLGEVGLENISTNMVAAKAGLTPPTLYRYFANKHDLLAALGERLMERQNTVLMGWLSRHAKGGRTALANNVAQLLRDTAAITDAEPGGAWILRALRASPKLAHIRVDSHRAVTDAQHAIFHKMLPDIDVSELWQRIRLAVELGFAAEEMRSEEDQLDDNWIFEEAARAVNYVITGERQ